jgi:hypothetical protein
LERLREAAARRVEDLLVVRSDQSGQAAQQATARRVAHSVRPRQAAARSAVLPEARRAHPESALG